MVSVPLLAVSTRSDVAVVPVARFWMFTWTYVFPLPTIDSGLFGKLNGIVFESENIPELANVLTPLIV